MVDTTKIQAMQLNGFAKLCHEANKKWWLDLTRACLICHGSGYTFLQPGHSVPCSGCSGEGYERKNRNTGELLMLIVSEIAEAMEGDRKNLMDDKLPHRKQLEVELADALIRIFDFCAGKGLDVGGAFVEKMEYNARRADHTIEQRLKEGGKKY